MKWMKMDGREEECVKRKKRKRTREGEAFYTSSGSYGKMTATFAWKNHHQLIVLFS